MFIDAESAMYMAFTGACVMYVFAAAIFFRLKIRETWKNLRHAYGMSRDGERVRIMERCLVVHTE